MQDKAIIEIGKIKGGMATKPYQNFIGNMFPGKNYDVIVAIFKMEKIENGYNCFLKKVDIEIGSNKNYLKYAYRKKKGSGGNFTFTKKISGTKTLCSILAKQIKFSTGIFPNHADLPIWNTLNEWINNNEEEFTNIITQKVNGYNPQKDSVGFTVAFELDNGLKYLEDLDIVREIIEWAGNEGKSKKYDVFSQSSNKVCSICHTIKDIVHGFASPFAYSTVDKTGLVSGFFKQKNNWKNYPICSDCALDFEKGQKYVTQHLSKYFYGKNYYIIPKLTAGGNPKLLKRALTVLEELDYKEKEGEKIATREDFLMRKIAKEEGSHNQFALNLLFFEENQTTKAIKIKLLLEGIFPSRFRTLFLDVPKVINNNPIYKEAITIKKEKQDLVFSFRVLKTFFDKDFYEIIQTVFIGLPISQELLFSKFANLIRSNYNKSKTSDGFVEPTRWTVLKAMMLLSYLKELNIIPKNKTSINMNLTAEKAVSTEETDKKTGAFDDTAFRDFVESNKDFFDLDNGYKAGIFAVGVLVRQVFNWQSVKLEGNTPFEKKLKGYHLNPNILKNVYLEALEKLNNYTSFHTYQGLRNFINEYFILNSHKLNQISNNELSFYFVAGLEFGNQFKTSKSNKNG